MMSEGGRCDFEGGRERYCKQLLRTVSSSPPEFWGRLTAYKVSGNRKLNARVSRVGEREEIVKKLLRRFDWR